MPIPASLKPHLDLPLIAAPMFLVSGPRLVIEACKNGVIGSFPSLNARPLAQYEEWLKEITGELGQYKGANPDKKVAPWGVNLIVHRSNSRLAEDAALTYEYEAPVVITSVGHPGDIAEAVHAYGGVVFHDVTNIRHAKKAQEAGVDGVILVCAGAGGHAGAINPFTLVPQVRDFFDGTIILAGALSDGRAIRAAQVLGADLAYMGTRFIATQESLSEDDYADMIIASGSNDIVYTDQVSGIMGNFLGASLAAAGVDPTPGANKKAINMDLGEREDDTTKRTDGKKAWKQIWSAGHGVGQIDDAPPVAELIARLKQEYEEAVARPVAD